MSHPIFKNGIFLAHFTLFENKITSKIYIFLNKAVIIIINLELYKSPLDSHTDILLTLLLAGQYILVILVMAPE